MNNLLTERLISLQEVALMAFAVFLLAAAPASDTKTESAEQPVKVLVPADENEEVQLSKA